MRPCLQGFKNRRYFNLFQAYRWTLAFQQSDRETRLDHDLLALGAKPLGEPVQKFPAAPPRRLHLPGPKRAPRPPPAPKPPPVPIVRLGVPRGGVRAPDLPALRASSGVSAVPGGPVRLQKTLSLGDPFNCDRQASQQIYYDGKNRGFKVSFQKEGLEGKRFMKSCPIGKQGQTMVSNVFGRHGGGVDEALKSCEKWMDANLSVSGIMGKNSVWHKDK
jgi:hypothetical protein